MPQKNPTIQNRKARHEFQFIETYIAGLVLKGTEVKSIREGQVQYGDSFCYFQNGELFIKGLQISAFSHGNLHNTDPVRDRKLLLSAMDLKRLKEKAEQKGLTLIPVKIFFNERNFAKIEIALAKGKKMYDKRQDLKSRDMKREIERE